jgi:hypothetical protein
VIFATTLLLPHLFLYYILCIVSAINNKTITESAAQIETTRSYMDLSFSRALKKNHDAMEQIGKPFVQRFKKHGVRPEIYHLSNSKSTTSEQETVAAALEGLESISKTLSIGDDVEIWVLLQFYRDQAHADEVHSNMMENESVGQLIKELDGHPGVKPCHGGFRRLRV